jgi:glycosyltransferase involved in cell wall biosynthesis
MAAPLVSAIITVFDGEDFVGEAIRSVLAQDYRPLETIVVDDGSTDATAEVVRQFESVRYIHQPNQGPSVGRNTGVAAASGDFMAFLDSDDLWLSNKLSVQIAYHLEHPEVGYTITMQRLVLVPGMERPSWLQSHLLDNDHVGYFPSALVVRSSVVNQVGGYDPSFRSGEGADWFARAKDLGIPMAIIDETLLLKRVHARNVSQEVDRSRAGVLRTLKASIDRQRRAKQASP